MAKIVIGIPPITSDKGTALISQNRQFQYSRSGTVIYPVVLASAATSLAKAGHEVIWMDGVADGLFWTSYLDKLISIMPDFILWEIKTPIVEEVMNISSVILNKFLKKTTIILCGDHVTALPSEIRLPMIIGGNYDDLIMKFLGYEPKRYTIDRELTEWRKYASRNGNFAGNLGAYTMFARDCWHRDQGGCTFCSWANLYPDFSVMSTDEAMAEVQNCVSVGAQEIFDDSGTFPVGKWMHEFCEKLRRLDHGKKRLRLGCNMRSGVLSREDWSTLAGSGFGYVLLGLESANDPTLEKLNKRYRVEDVVRSCELATRAGLDVHITSMVGFPWETEEDAKRTVALCSSLFKKGIVKSVQGTICVPYPGTRLFKEAKEKGWLLSEQWEDYDMTRPILLTDYDPMKYVREIYRSCLNPSFILRTLFTQNPIRTLKQARYFLNRTRDFQ